MSLKQAAAGLAPKQRFRGKSLAVQLQIALSEAAALHRAKSDDEATIVRMRLLQTRILTLQRLNNHKEQSRLRALAEELKTAKAEIATLKTELAALKTPEPAPENQSAVSQSAIVDAMLARVREQAKRPTTPPAIDDAVLARVREEARAKVAQKQIAPPDAVAAIPERAQPPSALSQLPWRQEPAPPPDRPVRTDMPSALSPVIVATPIPPDAEIEQIKQDAVKPLSAVAQIEADLDKGRDVKEQYAAAQANLARLRALKDSI